MDTEKRILIVEDEEPMANALKLKLEHEGYAVTAAADGEEGASQIKNGEFDLILLDLVMPNVDGFALLEQMREKGNDTPVVVISNLSQEEDEQKAKELGAKAFFIKSNVAITDIVDYVKTQI